MEIIGSQKEIKTLTNWLPLYFLDVLVSKDLERVSDGTDSYAVGTQIWKLRCDLVETQIVTRYHQNYQGIRLDWKTLTENKSERTPYPDPPRIRKDYPDVSPR